MLKGQASKKPKRLVKVYKSRTNTYSFSTRYSMRTLVKKLSGATQKKNSA